MKIKHYRSGLILITFLLLLCFQSVQAQRQKTHWAADGYQYYRFQGNQIVELDTRDAGKKTVLVTAENLTPPGQQPLSVANFYLSDDGQKVQYPRRLLGLRYGGQNFKTTGQIAACIFIDVCQIISRWHQGRLRK
jgi:hypothetical protein